VSEALREVTRYQALKEVCEILTGAWVQVHKASQRADACGNRDLAAEARHASEATRRAMQKAKLERARWERTLEDE
jgi:hypothetical protein